MLGSDLQLCSPPRSESRGRSGQASERRLASYHVPSFSLGRTPRDEIFGRWNAECLSLSCPLFCLSDDGKILDYSKQLLKCRRSYRAVKSSEILTKIRMQLVLKKSETCTEHYTTLKLYGTCLTDTFLSMQGVCSSYCFLSRWLTSLLLFQTPEKRLAGNKSDWLGVCDQIMPRSLANFPFSLNLALWWFTC